MLLNHRTTHRFNLIRENKSVFAITRLSTWKNYSFSEIFNSLFSVGECAIIFVIVLTSLNRRAFLKGMKEN